MVSKLVCTVLCSGLSARAVNTPQAVRAAKASANECLSAVFMRLCLSEFWFLLFLLPPPTPGGEIVVEVEIGFSDDLSALSS